MLLNPLFLLVLALLLAPAPALAETKLITLIGNGKVKAATRLIASGADFNARGTLVHSLCASHFPF